MEKPRLVGLGYNRDYLIVTFEIKKLMKDQVNKGSRTISRIMIATSKNLTIGRRVFVDDIRIDYHLDKFVS